MHDPNPEILEEVEDCICRVKEFHAAKGRKIHNAIKRSRKGREGLKELEQFNLPIPDDLKAVYWHYNGTKVSSSVSKWESSIFFEFAWYPIDMLIRGNKIMRLEKQNPLIDRLNLFRGLQARSLQIDPNDEQDGAAPLLMTLGPLSRNTYIAFDSILAMLRSVCAAQDAGILNYENKGRVAGKGRELDEIYYDLKEMWDVIRPFNTRTDYWPALIDGKVQWDKIDVNLPENGVLNLDPEVRRLILGDPQSHYKAAEEEMRKAGMSEEEIRKARSISKD